jgi:hypothetical protein
VKINANGAMSIAPRSPIHVGGTLISLEVDIVDRPRNRFKFVDLVRVVCSWLMNAQK